MEGHVTENNKAGGSAPPTAVSSMFHRSSQAADGSMVYRPSKIVRKHREFQELSSDQIDFACKVLTEKYNIDPKLARHSFIYDRVWVRRNGRKHAAEKFRKEYAYGSGKDKKTCIWPGDTLSWQDESSGTLWVGVHGSESICVVTRSGDLDATRLRGSLDHMPMHKVFFNFRKSLIDEIEDLADASSKLCQRFHQKIEKPFGVVSVIPDTDKAPSTEYGEMKAIEFLQVKLNSDTVFTVNETIQTAISAFQHLFQKKFNTDDIQVSVMDPKYVVTDKYKDPTVEELNMGQIKEHLDAINKHRPLCHNEKIEASLEDSCSDSQRLGEWNGGSGNGISVPEAGGSSSITSEATD